MRGWRRGGKANGVGNETLSGRISKVCAAPRVRNESKARENKCRSHPDKDGGRLCLGGARRTPSADQLGCLRRAEPGVTLCAHPRFRSPRCNRRKQSWQGKHDRKRSVIKTKQACFECAQRGTTGARQAAPAAGEKEPLSDGRAPNVLGVVYFSHRSLNMMYLLQLCTRNANPG